MVKKLFFASLGLVMMSAGCETVASERSDAIARIKQISHQKGVTGEIRRRKAQQYVFSLDDNQLAALVSQLGATRFIRTPEFRASLRQKATIGDTGVVLREIIRSPGLKARLQRQVAGFLFHITR